MAELLLSPILKVIFMKLAFTSMEQINLTWCVEEHLRRLTETLSTIKAVLMDAEQKQATNNQLRLWLGKLEAVLYDVDNVLDEFAYEALQQQLPSSEYCMTKVHNLFTFPGLRFNFWMGNQIKCIRVKLDEIALNRVQFHLIEGVIDSVRIREEARERTHSFVHHSEVIGRDADIENFVKLLTTIDIDQSLSVVPIVGIGGLGKTTFTKLVYNNEEVGEYFELRMWVCVSDDFDIVKLTKAIIEAGTTNGDTLSGLSFDRLQTLLRNTLKGKKFLLVLDDVWNEDQEQWRQLRELLLDGAKGSKTIVSTRSFHVASIMGTTQSYILKGLSEEDCWTLFAKCAFREGEEKNYPNLKKFGKEIIKKCMGVPLAVRSLGSMLFMKTDESDWFAIKNSDIWRLEQNKNGILAALKLSYKQLPSYLKRCFTFCSIFPKDYNFDNLKLIQMWMSQGFIQSSAENEGLEEIGQRYINELCSMYFFQDRTDFGHVMTFKMHDLVHDLALSEAQNECYTVNNHPGPRTISNNFRHVPLYNTEDVPISIFDLRDLRTLYYIPHSRREGANESFVKTCITRFQFLRMLDMTDSTFKELSRSIGSLNHLKYLNLSYNIVIRKLPDEICKLLLLQTLVLLGCTELEELPRDIGNLISLRALWITARKLNLLPNKEIGLLTSLRFLYIESCPNLITSVERVERLPSLRILIFIKCHNLEAWPGIMKHLPTLESLVIRDCEKLNLMDSTEDDFGFMKLQYLQIVELPELNNLPVWFLGCLNTIQVLIIARCPKLSTLPDMKKFKSLQKLVIYECGQISALPEGMSHLTSLRELEIIKCSLSGNIGEIWGEEWDKISHVAEIIIEKRKITKGDDVHIIEPLTLGQLFAKLLVRSGF